MNTDAKQLSLALTAPFPPDAVHWKPLAVKGNRALAAAYLDARAVMQRLDSVFGVGGWRDSYQLVNGGSVVCTLSVKVDGEWIDKTDVGSPSEQPDDGDRLKAAFSDSLKRAACKLGVGRYLYKLPRQWVDYDTATKQFVKAPQLPAWALPAVKQSA
ncbi:MAG: Rad52/Rad22 family DNA repair protein [Gemmataceae bacterium]